MRVYAELAALAIAVATVSLALQYFFGPWVSAGTFPFALVSGAWLAANQHRRGIY